MTASAMDLIYQNYSANRGLVEKWLQYPRMLQMEYGINPIMAGGCMRDLILGGEVKDLDIFISQSSWLSDKAFTDAFDIYDIIAQREGWEFQREGEEIDHTDILGIYKFTSAFIEQTYNIIVLNEDSPSQAVIKDFNFGINQIAVNTYSILAISPQFLTDVDKQQATICNEQPRELHIKAYEELLQKYPALPLVTKEGLEIEKPHAGLILPPGV